MLRNPGDLRNPKTNGSCVTQVRRALKTFVADTPEYERLLPFVKGNVGFVFTNGDLKEVRDKILANKVAAPARAGAVAPADVWVPAGNTGMEPGKTSFFQALGVPTKIARGTIEITTDLKLIEAGAKVGPSEATLLNLLNISPFTYGMGIAQVYDQGNTFGSDVLDISEEQLLKAFSTAITTIASLSLALNFPTLPSVIHSVVNAYKKVLAVAIETEISWPEIEELKDRIANPEAYASAAPAASTEAAPAAKAEEKEEEKEESDEDDGGFGGLLCVFPDTNPCCVTPKLIDALATKCLPDFLIEVPDGRRNWFRLGKETNNLGPQLRRSFAAQSSTSLWWSPSDESVCNFGENLRVHVKMSCLFSQAPQVSPFSSYFPCTPPFLPSPWSVDDEKKSKSFLTLIIIDENPSQTTTF